MKIVKIIGGLGNQMFQYAFLVALRERFGRDVLMDTDLFETYKVHNGFELDRVFNITAGKARKEDIKRLTRYTKNYFLSRVYNRLLPPKETECCERKRGQDPEGVMSDDKDYYYDGYWQSHLYFDRYRDVVMKEFLYKEELDERNLDFVKVLKASPVSVSLHIRRGDYLKHKLYRGLCGEDYYIQAIGYLKEKYGNDMVFAVFSNDTAWCKEHLSTHLSGYEQHYVDWNTGKESYKDMRLMSVCKINVIANSSFSWWAAYLNRNADKEIIAPAKWINPPLKFDGHLPDWVLF